MHYTNIPEHMRGGIERYVEEGIRPGDFLYLILCNDFVHAACIADDQNLNALKAYAELLYWELPSACWGSKEKVATWINMRREPVAG